jgi:hypothetical protein
MEDNRFKSSILRSILLILLFIWVCIWLSSCSDESGIKYKQVWYLKDDVKNRIFVYVYNWDLKCEDITKHWSSLINTAGQTTWAYYFKEWSNYPSNEISTKNKFYDWQVVMENYSSDYSFVHVTQFDSTTITKYNGTEWLNCQ